MLHVTLVENDRADELAKAGRFKLTATTINLKGIPNHNISLVWNDEVLLDKDIRKYVGKIIDFRWLDNHLNHRNLADIRLFTQKQMINWAVTSKYFHMNGRNDTTSKLHSKDVSWKVKSSINSLPTLDTLNRNFPDLIKDQTNCLLCDNAIETNEHLWRCASLLPHIRTSFQELADCAQEILRKDADKLNLYITDSIKYSNTFRWSLRSEETITDNAILLLRSYVSEDLYRSFRTHFNTYVATVKSSLKFMDLSGRLIKQKIWKVRSSAWKDKKRTLNITKRSFKQYQRTSNNQNTRSFRQRNFGYICPQTVSLRNYYNRADLIFVILASSNFLHNGLMFNQLSYNLSENVSTFVFPHSSCILMA